MASRKAKIGTKWLVRKRATAWL